MIDLDKLERVARRRAAARASAAPDPEWFDATSEYLDATSEPAIIALVAELRACRFEIDALTVARNADRTEWMTTYETMRALLDEHTHEDLDAFADGELSEARADAFRLHLATCPACEAGLLGRMQVTAILSTSRDKRAAVVDAAVAYVRADGSLGAIIDAVSEMGGHDWAPQACTEAIGCPRCGAVAGERCATDRPLHLERWDAWKATGFARSP